MAPPGSRLSTNQSPFLGAQATIVDLVGRFLEMPIFTQGGKTTVGQ